MEKSQLAIIIFLLIAIQIQPVVSIIYSGSFTANGLLRNPHSHNFVGGANTIALIQMVFNPVAPPSYVALLVATTSTAIPSINLINYQKKNPLNQVSYDYQNANSGKKQVVQISGLSAGNTININVINFNQKAFAYTVTVTEKSTNTNLCPASATARPSSLYCQSCAPLVTSGAYCQYQIITLSQQSRAITIPGGEYVPLLIKGSDSKIQVLYQSSHAGTQIYFQFQSFNGEMAGLVNHDASGDFKTASASVQYYVRITSSGKNILAGIVNQQNTPIVFTIRYSIKTTVSVLIIVLGVLGGLLFIALVIAAFFIVKHLRNQEQIIHPRPSMVESSRFRDTNNLTAQEIQQYFPSVNMKNLFAVQQHSELSLSPHKHAQSPVIDRDCVICLNPIQDSQMMKVTYCKHIFHAHCLIQWFSKQRNCPYCREQFNKKATMDHYAKVLRSSGKTYLSGLVLAQEVFRAKMIHSHVQIEEVKDD